MSNSWQHFSVEEFFSQNNWSGVISTKGNDVLQDIPWLCQKIEDFFSNSNWQGGIFSEIRQTDFSLTLSVEGFFQLFPWESGSKIAHISNLEPLPEFNLSSNDELTLDNFGNLF